MKKKTTLQNSFHLKTGNTNRLCIFPPFHKLYMLNQLSYFHYCSSSPKIKESAFRLTGRQAGAPLPPPFKPTTTHTMQSSMQINSLSGTDKWRKRKYTNSKYLCWGVFAHYHSQIVSEWEWDGEPIETWKQTFDIDWMRKVQTRGNLHFKWLAA